MPRQRRERRLLSSQQRLNALSTVLFIIGVVFVLLYSISNNDSSDSVSSGLFTIGEAAVNGEKSRRRFVSYTSSLWEQLWLNNIQGWEKERLICKKLKSEAQFPFIRAFMKTTCTFQYEGTPWCTVDDGTGEKRRFWYNLETGKVAREAEDISDLPPSGFKNWIQVFESRKSVKPFAPEALESSNEVPMVFSRLDFVDDVTGKPYSEYIEPLVSHLRHPLSACFQKASYTTRAYVIPPPGDSPLESKKFYFDAGASRWSSGEGGPSLSFFTEVWKRHGIDFDHIECWEGTTRPEKFYSTVPEE